MPSPLMTELRRVRKLHGFSQASLARASGFTEHQICKWELGQNDPGVLNFEAVANAIGYDVVLARRGGIAMPQVP